MHDAASTNRRFTLRGGPIEPTIDSVSDELELREQALPNATDWDTALQRAASLFGLTLAQTLNAANVGRLVDEVKQAASGNEVTREFCPSCGTHLFARSSGRPDVRVVRTGNLDDPSSIRPGTNIWASSAPGWACLDPAMERVERQPVPPKPSGS